MILDIINKKRLGKELSYEELDFFFNGYLDGKVADYQMSSLLMAICINGMTDEEIYALTKIFIDSGDVLDFSDIPGIKVDKHSTGGIGDKTTLVIAPIAAACGVPIIKMSGRGLGYTGGTIDKLESITGYKLNLTKKQFLEELDKVGCAVISQSEKIAVADKKIYALRNEIGAVDSIPLIASSIMSKKIASGSDVIIIDLKVGKGAFMKNIKSATKLAKTMVKIGEYYDKKVICTLSDMNIPLGRNIGNALEVKEAMDFFDGKYDKRLYELSVYISSLMISSAKKISFTNAKKLVINLLESGHAKNKFYEWIKSQGGNIHKLKDKAKKVDIISTKTGYVNSIDSNLIAELVFNLGAGRVKKTDPVDYAVGVTLNKVIGDKVKEGEVLGTIYYNKKLDGMDKLFINSFKIEKKKKRVKKIIIKTIK